MKRIIIILLLVLGIHVTIASRAQAPTIHEVHQGIKITDAQKKELERLVRLYKYQIKKLFDLYQQGTTSNYVHRTNNEFQYIIEQTRSKLSQTIQAIKDLYKRIGISDEQIKNEEQRLQKVLVQ